MHRRAHIHQHANLGEKIADAVCSVMGSWRFIIIQSVVVLTWIGFNLWLLSRPFDAYPFILLNLLFSTQAAYASPLILMSQNRQASKDRARDDLEAKEVDDLFTNHALLLKINQQQLEILQLLRPQEKLQGVSPIVNPKTRIRPAMKREDLL